VRRRRAARFLHFNRSNVATSLATFRAAQSLFEVRELCIPSADVRQQIGISATFMSAPGTFDYEKWLTPENRSTTELQSTLSDRAIPVFQHEILKAA
jgi:hypothetical protein